MLGVVQDIVLGIMIGVELVLVLGFQVNERPVMSACQQAPGDKRHAISALHPTTIAP